MAAVRFRGVRGAWRDGAKMPPRRPARNPAVAPDAVARDAGAAYPLPPSRTSLGSEV
jgi:hypothetical protein